MALSPLRPADERFVDQSQQASTEPLKTYHIDFDSGRMRGYADGEAAVRQFVRKAIATARYRYLIYDGRYGCEIDQVIGANVTDELVRAEIPRMIREALEYDERIESADDFEITHEGNKMYVNFRVTTADGLILDERAVI